MSDACQLPGCGRPLKETDDVLRCCACGRSFHLECSGSTKTVLNSIKRDPNSVRWSCSYCSKNVSNLFDLFVSVRARVDSLEEKVDASTKDFDRRLKLLESNPSPGPSGSGGGDIAQGSVAPGVQPRPDVFSEVLSEMKDIELRKCNMLLFGVKESSSESTEDRKKHDEKEITGVFRALGPNALLPYNVKAFFRVGKPRAPVIVGNEEPRPRPLKIILDSEDAKKELLSCGPRLMRSTFSHVYVKADLTKRQQEERNRMLQQRRSRRSEDEPPEAPPTGRTSVTPTPPVVPEATGSPSSQFTTPRAPVLSFLPSRRVDLAKNGKSGPTARL
jgi:hypothetical protein